jgi:rhodanese-related sulfurtransferase
VLVGRDDADALHAAELAAAVGVGRIAGYLAGGMTSWREERLPTASIQRVTVDELHELDVQIIDVRERDEWEAGHIPNSHFAPYHDIRALPDGLDASAPVAVICASGQRAAVGASLIQRYGAHDVLHVVDGGVPAWERAGYPIQR